MHTAIIDADSIYFRVACTTFNEKNIRFYIDKTIEDIMVNTFSNNLKVAIKGNGNFRKDLYEKYKANRPKIDPEIVKALQYGHQYMIDAYDGVTADGCEADDLVAIWAKDCRENNESYTIVGIDKDLLQIQGEHYNFTTRKIQKINTDKGHKLLMLQCLTGDISDNIPGIRGIGPVKGEKILENVCQPRRWNRVKAAWRGHRAGNPEISRTLLTMIDSFEELEFLNYEISQEKSPSEICKSFNKMREDRNFECIKENKANS